MSRRDEIVSRAAWGVVVGVVLALLDHATSRWFVTDPVAPLTRVAILGLLPALGAVAAAAFGTWPGALSFVAPTTLAWTLGDQLRRGARATEMPLAPWWGFILAIVVFAAWLVLRRRALRSPASRRLFAALGAVGAVGGFLLAATVQRGRYDAPRAVVVAGVGVLLFAAAMLVRRRWPKPLAWSLVILSIPLFGVGIWVAKERQAAVDWAEQGTTATRYPARFVRSFVADDLAAPTGDGYRSAPYFGAAAERESSHRLERAGGPPKGVLFLTVDALRADMIGRTVAGRSVTPRLDELQRKSFVFERAYCAHPSSNLSLLSMFSGRYPSHVMAQIGGLDELPLVVDELRDTGVVTRAVFPEAVHTKLTPKHHFTRRDFGFSRGGSGDTVRITPWKDMSPGELWDFVRPTNADERWFTWVHYIRPHQPYTSAADEFVAGDSDFERYAAEIRQTDDEIATLLDLMDKDGFLDDTWVVVSADHGEAFKEHGFTAHGGNVYEEQIHVPLIVHGRGVPVGRSSTPVSLVDLTPTLHQLFDVPGRRDGRFAGRSWLPLLFDVDDPGRIAYALAECPPLTIGLQPVLVTAVGEQWKIIVDERLRRFYVFDLDSDPGEKNNLAEADVARRDELWAWIAKIRGLVAGTGETENYYEVDRRLAYIDGGEFVQPHFLTQVFDQLVNVQDDYATFALSYLADGTEPRFVATFIEHFEARTDLDVRAAAAAARFGNRIERSGDRETLAARLATTTDPFLAVAVYQAAHGRRDPFLLDVVTGKSEPESMKLAVDLARLRYRRSFGRDDNDESGNIGNRLVDRGIRHENAWVRRLAFEAMIDAPRPDLADRLLDTVAVDNHVRIRAAILEACGRLDDKRMTSVVFARARSGTNAWVRRRAFSGLAASRRQPPGVVRRKASANEIDGVEIGADGFHHPTSTVVDISLDGVHGPGFLALFATWRHFGKPVPRVVLRAGDWGRKLDHPETDPTVPIIAMVPPGIDLSSIRLEITHGSPDDVILEGVLFAPAGPHAKPLVDDATSPLE